MKRRTTLISSITVLALAGAGTAVAVTAADDDAPARAGSSVTDRTSPSAPPRNSSATPGTSVSPRAGAAPRAEDVIAAALARVPGVATEADLDSAHGRTVWEVDIAGDDGERHRVDVDPTTGVVVRTHVRHDDDHDRDDDKGHDDDHSRDDDHGHGDEDHDHDRVSLAGIRTSAQDAARIAAAHGTVRSVELDDHAWEVETRSADGTEREWRISLTSVRQTPQPSGD